MNINTLFSIIKNRKDKREEGSYVSSLFNKGIDRIAQKVGEEATEVVIAAKNDENDKFIEEMADLWFHSLVLLAQKGVTPDDIFDELEKRHKKR